MLGVNWLRSNRIVWDFAKDLLIVNGEVFDMILEEKSQEFKRRRWLTEINNEEENERDDEKVKISKIEKTDEVKVINRIWALPIESKIHVDNDVCIFRAPVGAGTNPHDIRYPCFLCGPSTTGFSRARDLMRHSCATTICFRPRCNRVNITSVMAGIWLSPHQSSTRDTRTALTGGKRMLNLRDLRD